MSGRYGDYPLGKRGRKWDAAHAYSAALLTGAVNYSHAQIYNPSDSGVIVLVDSFLVAASATKEFSMGTTATEIGGGTSISNVPHLIDSPTASAVVRAQNRPSALSVNEIWAGVIQQNENMQRVFSTPFELDNGEGLVFLFTETTGRFEFAFEWREYPN